MAMFVAFPALFVCKLLKIHKLLVEAAGVEPAVSTENTQVTDTENARNWPNSTIARAIFEDWTQPNRFPIHQLKSRKVAENDPDLLEALRILGLVIGDWRSQLQMRFRSVNQTGEGRGCKTSVCRF
jgi:hypothetical protein